MSGFITVDPIEVTDAVLVGSSILEDEHPAWAAGTFAQFDRVIYKHMIYEDGIGGASAKPPDEDAMRWNAVDPTNLWRIFDQTQLALTRAPNSAQLRFRPGRAIQGLIAIEQEGVSSMRVRLENALGQTIYDRSTSTEPMPESADYYYWFAGPLAQLSPVELQTGFPSDPDALLIIDFEGGPDMQFGPILFGDVREWGMGVKEGGRIVPTDYSLNEPNAFGRIKYVPRGHSMGGSFQIVLENKQLDEMRNYFMRLRRKPAALIASDMWTSTIFYGRFNFEIVIASSRISEASLDIKGLVNNG